MQKLKLCLLALLWPALNCFAQSPPSIRPLKVGDTLPHITLTNVFNYPVSKIQLSDLKGKLIILDFWATWCGSCIAMFPAIDSLQQQFRQQLQIIMVNSVSGTGDSKDKVMAFFKTWNAKHHTSFQTAYAIGDTLAKKLFPHTFLPHYVWIGKKGQVLAITSSEQLTKENILLLLNGGAPPAMAIKKDKLFEK